MSEIFTDVFESTILNAVLTFCADTSDIAVRRMY